MKLSSFVALLCFACYSLLSVNVSYAVSADSSKLACDSQQQVVKKHEKKGVSAQKSVEATAAVPVALNQATAEQLAALKGLGDKKAQAIVDYRTKHGAFQSIADLDNVKGIGPGLLKKVQPQLTLNG